MRRRTSDNNIEYAIRNSMWKHIDYSEGGDPADCLIRVVHPSTSLFTTDSNYEIPDLTHLLENIHDEPDEIPDLTHLLEEVSDEMDEETAQIYANDPFANPEARKRLFPDASGMDEDIRSYIQTDIEFNLVDEETAAAESSRPRQTLCFDDFQLTKSEVIDAYLEQIPKSHLAVLDDWENGAKAILKDEKLRIGFGLYVGTLEAMKRKALYIAALEADSDFEVIRAYQNQGNVASLAEYRNTVRLSSMPPPEGELTRSYA